MATFKGRLPGGAPNVTIEDKRIVRRYVERYRVVAESATEDRNEILGTPGLPLVNFSPHPNNAFAVCKDRDAEQDDNNRLEWIVTAEFDTVPGPAENENDQSNDPLDFTPEISWDTEEIQWTVFEDLDGLSAVNSAGDAYEGGLQTTLQIPVLSIQRFEATFSDSVKRAYEGRTNSGSFRGYAENQALMSRIQARRQTFDGSFIWQVNYTIKFNDYFEDGWKLQVLDYGPNLISNGNKVPFLTEEVADKPQVTRNGLLDGSGGESATAVYNKFRVNRQANFSDLNLEGI